MFLPYTNKKIWTSRSMDEFHTSDRFLRMAKAAARAAGYDSSKLSLAGDGKHKLKYESPDGLRRFGARGYGDFNYYKTFQPEVADKRRSAYRARASANAAKQGRNSAAALALAILW
jgi:hypothetical protein